MKWADKPTVHHVDAVFSPMGDHCVWRPGDPTRDHAHVSTFYRTCGYCGSLHPEDLLEAHRDGRIVTLGGSDWKYGFPHKFYVDLKNPEPDRVFNVGSRAAKQDKLFGKFYTEHLGDQGIDDEAFAAIAAVLQELGGIEFSRDEKGVKYKAPHHGYQR